jgi:hypothetical protein
MQSQGFGLRDLLLANIVFAIAGTVRAGYVLACLQEPQQPPPIQVQDAATAITLNRGDDPAKFQPTDADTLVDNIAQSSWFGGRAPLATEEEVTAHVAPGYPYLVAYISRWLADADKATKAIIWAQCALGAVTAVLCFLFARIAFGSTLIGLLAGLLAAIHPFWIVNVAELQDGPLICFLLAGCLFLGTAADKHGSPLASLLFGGALAALALVRAALLPFSIVGFLWFLPRCMKLHRGWLCGLLAFLGFGNGLAPWTVRNFQVFGEVVPMVDCLPLHLWMGNNAKARGAAQDEKTLESTFSAERLQMLLAESQQARRYRMLWEDVANSAKTDIAGTLEKRLRSGVAFTVGADWAGGGSLSRDTPRDDMPSHITEWAPVALRAMLLCILGLGLVGWRWSCGWNRDINLASLAMLWIPLPYILSHAEQFSGPRLPLDAVLLCYSAFTLGRILWPGSLSGSASGPQES